MSVADASAVAPRALGLLPVVGYPSVDKLEKHHLSLDLIVQFSETVRKLKTWDIFLVPYRVFFSDVLFGEMLTCILFITEI